MQQFFLVVLTSIGLLILFPLYIRILSTAYHLGKIDALDIHIENNMFTNKNKINEGLENEKK